MDKFSGSKNIIWTQKARRDLLQVLSYWKERNRSDEYPRKLRQLFIEAIDRIALQPMLGSRCDVPNIYLKIVRDYWIFYTFNEFELKIIQIVSTRRSTALIYKQISEK